MNSARLYLIVLTVLYAAFAAWSTFKPRTTANSLGFDLQSPSGVCEFIVVYGGLELGLALFFALGAFRESAELPALWLALLLHTALVAFRLVIILTTSGLSSTIFAIFGLEALLAVAAAILALPRGLPQ